MENPSVITAAVLAVCKQWHGSIDQQFSCIDNVVERSERYTLSWPLPVDVGKELADNHRQLDALIKRCRTTAGSPMDRTPPSPPCSTFFHRW